MTTADKWQMSHCSLHRGLGLQVSVLHVVFASIDFCILLKQSPYFGGLHHSLLPHM